MAVSILTLVGSASLGLQAGGWSDLDRVVSRFSREQLVLRVVALLNALATSRDATLDLNASYVKILPSELAARIRAVRSSERNATFLEPWQQLVILKRALAVGPQVGEKAFGTPEGETAFFDACRFAADVLDPGSPFEGESTQDSDAWIKIAANMMPRIWLSNPPAFGASIARLEVMLGDTPHANALKERFPDAIGLTVQDAHTLIRFLAVWVNRLKLKDLFADPAAIRFNPATWLGTAKISQDSLDRFLSRTSRPVALKMDETTAGTKTSTLPFRDRPFLEFSDKTMAACFPPFIVEKLTADVFWWLKDIGSDQSHAWQQDWGYVAEDYVIRVLKGIAIASGCHFAVHVESTEGEVDALMWRDGQVALFEVTTSSLREAESSTTDWRVLRTGLLRAFVQNPTPPKNEAVLQLVRDAKLAVTGQLPCATAVERIYPVMVTADRRTRTPGVVRFLQPELSSRLLQQERQLVAPLAVWHFEDLETIDGLVAQRSEWRTGSTRGPFTLLKLWDWEAGTSDAWWRFIDKFYAHPPRSPALESAYKNWRGSIAENFEDVES